MSSLLAQIDQPQYEDRMSARFAKYQTILIVFLQMNPADAALPTSSTSEVTVTDSDIVVRAKAEDLSREESSETDPETNPNRVSETISVSLPQTSRVSKRKIQEAATQGVLGVADTLASETPIQSVHSGLGTTSWFLRGADSGKVHLIWDGMSLDDPSATQGTLDLSLLDTLDLDSIDVTPGPSAGPYGQAALGGVVEFRTKTPSRNQTKVWFSGEMLPTQSAGNNLGAATAVNQEGVYGIPGSSQFYRFSAAWQNSVAPSAARNGTEPDPAGGLKLSGHTGRNYTTGWMTGEADLQARWNSQKTAIDGLGPSGPMDDPDAEVSTEHLIVNARGNFRPLTTSFVTEARASYSGLQRRNLNPAQSDSVSTEDFRYRGDSAEVMLNQKIGFAQNAALNIGIIRSMHFANSDEAGSKRNSRSGGLGTFLEWKQPNGFPYLFAQLRWDRQDEGFSAFSFRASPGVDLIPEHLKLTLTAASVFQAPTLYQRYSIYGNPSLQPEQATGGDVAILAHNSRQNLKGALSAFQYDYLQLVEFDLANSRYINRSRARMTGLEARGEWEFTRGLRLLSSYQWLWARDLQTEEPLPRRASERGQVGIGSSWIPKTQMELTAQATGERTDIGTSGSVRLAPYVLWNLSAEYRPARDWTLFSRVHNVFDRRYEDVWGYSTSGLKLSAGFSKVF